MQTPKMGTSGKPRGKEAKNLVKKSTLFDFYLLKKQKNTKVSNNIQYITLSSDEDVEQNNNVQVITENNENDNIEIIKEEFIRKEIIEETLEINESPQNTFSFKSAILKSELSLKPRIYKPIDDEEKDYSNKLDSNKKKIPEYRIHTFPSSAPADSEKITVDYFPKVAVTRYHFITHLHSDHHVGFSKKWFSDNKDTIIVLGEQNYLPFLYKFNLINVKSECKPLEDDYRNVTDRIIVVPESGEATIYFNNHNERHMLVKTIDANHCIGAILFFIEYYDSKGDFKERILHTGDFRFHSEKMLPLLKGIRFNKIYLDTTYISPIWNFTPKDVLLEHVTDFMQHKLLPSIKDSWFNKNSLIQKTLDSFFSVNIDNTKVKTLIVLGSYTIGKEFLAAGLSEKFKNCPVVLDKIGIRATFDLPGSNFIRSTDIQKDITENFKISDVVIFLGSIRDSGNIKTELKLYQVEKYFSKLLTVSISLSGWNFYKWKNFFQDLDDIVLLPKYTKENCEMILKEFNNNDYVKKRFQLDEIMNSNLIFNEEFDLATSPKWILKHDKETRVIFWKLSYSDHSSYKELSDFCAQLEYDSIIATVNDHKKELVNYHLELWKMCNTNK